MRLLLHAGICSGGFHFFIVNNIHFCLGTLSGGPHLAYDLDDIFGVYDLMWRVLLKETKMINIILNIQLCGSSGYTRIA